MKKIMLGSYILTVLLAAFQIEAVGKNGAGINPSLGQRFLGTTPDSRPPISGSDLPTNSVQKQFEAYRARQDMVNHPGHARQILGGNPSTWAPTQIQLEVLRLSREFSNAAAFMQEVAQGLASLRKNDPSTFEKYFGNTGSSSQGKNLASELEPSLEIAK